MICSAVASHKSIKGWSGINALYSLVEHLKQEIGLEHFGT